MDLSSLNQTISNWNYMATLAEMAVGADAAYINEEKFGIKELTSDLEILASKMDKGQVFRGLLLINEKANPNYNIDFLRRFTSIFAKVF